MNENIYLILVITLELLNYLLIYKVFFHVRLKDNKCWLLCLLAVYAIIFWINFYVDDYFPEKYIILLGITIPLTLFKGNTKKWLSIYPIVAMISSVFLVFVTYIFAICKEKTYMEAISEPLIVLQSETLLFSFFFVIYMYCRKKRTILYDICLKRNQYILLYTYMVFSVIILALTEGVSSNYILSLQWFNLYGTAIAGICILCLVYAFWNGIIIHNKQEQEHQIEQLNTYMSLQERQFDAIIKSDKKLRAYRHDMRAHLLALQAMCHEKNQPELAEYINKNITESEIFHTVSYTGNVAVDAILQNLREEAEKQGITVDYQCRMAEDNPVSLYDLCTVLSNLLDNAIEANQQATTEKRIILKMYSVHERLYISVKNTAIYPATVKDGILITSKTDKYHGIGSRNVRQVVDSYGGSIEYKNEDGYFYVEIFL